MINTWPCSQATPRFYFAAVEKNFSPRLRDKIWEWPGNEATPDNQQPPPSPKVFSYTPSSLTKYAFRIPEKCYKRQASIGSEPSSPRRGCSFKSRWIHPANTQVQGNHLNSLIGGHMSPNTLAIFVLQSSASLLLNKYVVACSPCPSPSINKPMSHMPTTHVGFI